MFHDCDESELLVHDRLAEKSIRHHRSFHGLKDAARFGCHLCNLIELYCTGSPIDLDLPVVLNLDRRDRRQRKYAFNVSTEKGHTKVQLGLIGIYNCAPALSCGC